MMRRLPSEMHAPAGFGRETWGKWIAQIEFHREVCLFKRLRDRNSLSPNQYIQSCGEFDSIESTIIVGQPTIVYSGRRKYRALRRLYCTNSLSRSDHDHHRIHKQQQFHPRPFLLQNPLFRSFQAFLRCFLIQNGFHHSPSA
jgi:hypothetical protein